MHETESLVMNKKRTLKTVLLALLCVPASAVGIVWGFIGGCVIAMMLAEILEPGSAYDHYSLGTPIGNIVLLGPVAVGAAAPWGVLCCYVLRVNMKRTLWTVLLALLCVPASAVGILLGFIGGCMIAMMLVSVLEPGAGYDHYSLGTPIGNVVILGAIAVGAAAPWIAWGFYTLRAFRGGRQPTREPALGSGRKQATEDKHREAQTKK